MRGYVVAQPIAPLFVPAAHEIAAVGLIDDFYNEDFADILALSAGGSSSADLLAAAPSIQVVLLRARRYGALRHDELPPLHRFSLLPRLLIATPPAAGIERRECLATKR